MRISVKNISGLGNEIVSSSYERSSLACSTHNLNLAIKYAKEVRGKSEELEEYSIRVLLHEYKNHCSKSSLAEKYSGSKQSESFYKAKLLSERILNI